VGLIHHREPVTGQERELHIQPTLTEGTAAKLLETSLTDAVGTDQSSGRDVALRQPPSVLEGGSRSLDVGSDDPCRSSSSQPSSGGWAVVPALRPQPGHSHGAVFHRQATVVHMVFPSSPVFRSRLLRSVARFPHTKRSWRAPT
jgi:hypothetical protein